MTVLSERLRKLRVLKKATQVQTANACNMAARAYQRIEAGYNPNYENLLALAEFFEVSTDYLTGRKPYAYRLEKRMISEEGQDIETYGIVMYDNEVRPLEIMDITDDGTLLKKYIDLIDEFQVAPEHLQVIVEDFILFQQDQPHRS